MRARMYDPRTGRFTQTDPIAGNRPWDHYLYASNNPVSRIDPMGTQDLDPVKLAKQYNEHPVVVAEAKRVEALKLALPKWTAADDAELQRMYDEAPVSEDYLNLAKNLRAETGRTGGIVSGVLMPFETIKRKIAIQKLEEGDESGYQEYRAYGSAKLGGSTSAAGILAGGVGRTVLTREIAPPAPRVPRPLGANAGVPKEGIYEFRDATAEDKPYVGQSGNIPSRLNQHRESGRLPEGVVPKTREVTGGKTAREIAEHRRIQELTGGVPAKDSPNVANERDPIGPGRQHLLKDE